jgi:hypothetical protein
MTTLKLTKQDIVALAMAIAHSEEYMVAAEDNDNGQLLYSKELKRLAHLAKAFERDTGYVTVYTRDVIESFGEGK